MTKLKSWRTPEERDRINAERRTQGLPPVFASDGSPHPEFIAFSWYLINTIRQEDPSFARGRTRGKTRKH